MSQQLIDHSSDLKRLRDEGYEIEICGGYLLIHHIPYVDNKKEVKFGTLVSELNLSNNTTTAAPSNHVIHFTGENPCNNDGTIISAIQHSNQRQDFGDGIMVNHSFSNKPPGGYANYYDKFTRYAEIISAPAKYLDDTLTEKTFNVIATKEGESIFQYVDTNSSRANINKINSKFMGQRIAIIGSGGTGAYALDLISKTPVDEIHVYDGDGFLQHNAFRSPGAASIEMLQKKMMKADYFAGVYSKMHKKVIPHSYYVTTDNLLELDTMSFVFICVDKNSVRKMITDYLVSKGIPFIDVGMGVNIVDDKLIGSVRTTSATASKNDHLQDRICAEENEDNDYSTNIQIADLNSLNASYAVIKWKKMSGFYQDLEEEHHSVYSVNVSKIFNEDAAA